MPIPGIPAEMPSAIPPAIPAAIADDGVDDGLDDWIGTTLGLKAGVGVGVDIVDTRELADMIEASGPSFINMCWTLAEQAYCAGSLTRLAARWAAKEATMKALGHGIGEVDPLDIEVVATEGEPPSLTLHGSAAAYARELGMSQLTVSLTHEADFAVAFVVAMGKGSAVDAGAVDLTTAGRGSAAHRSRVIRDGVAIAEQTGRTH
jgi:holo-[acyl-carrier protein] synthase